MAIIEAGGRIQYPELLDKSLDRVKRFGRELVEFVKPGVRKNLGVDGYGDNGAGFRPGEPPPHYGDDGGRSLREWDRDHQSPIIAELLLRAVQDE